MTKKNEVLNIVFQIKSKKIHVNVRKNSYEGMIVGIKGLFAQIKRFYREESESFQTPSDILIYAIMGEETIKNKIKEEYYYQNEKRFMQIKCFQEPILVSQVLQYQYKWKIHEVGAFSYYEYIYLILLLFHLLECHDDRDLQRIFEELQKR